MKIILVAVLLSSCSFLLCGAFQPSYATTLHKTTQPRGGSVFSLRSSVNGFVSSNSNVTTTVKPKVAHTPLTTKFDVPLLGRSALVGSSCLATWGLTQYTSLSIIQASGLVGVASCFGFWNDPSSAAAAFCGSFAGMSAQISSLSEAGLLGVCCAVIYHWWTRAKLQLGKGGRLGTIAFVGNLLYFVLRRGAFFQVLMNQMKVLQPSTALAALGTSLVLFWQKRRGNVPTKAEELSTPRLSLTESSMASAMPKLVLLGVLLARLFATTTASSVPVLDVFVRQLLPAVLTTFISSIAVKKSPGVVMPVAVIGILAGTLLPTPLAASSYMGAFLGMTGLATFRSMQFLEASVLSTTLLQLGALAGFGGKLGFLAFVGVNFAM